MTSWLQNNLGIVIAILAHAAASVWWASKMDSTLKSVADSLTRIDKELEKRDVAIKAIGDKLDNIKERVIILEHNGK